MCKLMKYTRLKIISSSLIIQKYKLFFIWPVCLHRQSIEILIVLISNFMDVRHIPMLPVNRIGTHISQVDPKINRRLNFDGNYVKFKIVVNPITFKV